MECLEDIRSILQGIVFAQSAGAYTLDQSEQIAPIVRRFLNRYPQLNGNQPRPVQQSQQPQQPQRQVQQTTQPQRQVQQSTQPQQVPQKKLKQREDDKKVDELIQNIKAEMNKVDDAESNIEVEPVKQSALDIEDTDIESISLPLE